MSGGALVASLGGTIALTAVAQAQLIAHRDLSLSLALAIATTASAACKANGYTVSVAVVGRDGQIIVHLRGDDAPPHTMENSYRRAYTARTYRQSSFEIEKRLRADPLDPLVRLSNVMPAQGGLPITVGNDTIGGVGVSGAPGGDRDEACARAGLDRASDQLK